ncbi:amidophosphoribosyltransferase [Methanobrevibacter curvatus]|uniref:Amidophosphoribosyltransferase n=1 Tax=Methanobrevibacter curvatus TaxID=49547 RepID=A0A166AB39_9EURY|nr:amidophosphoribosyltransferase [Methanobrevibacter curvatus]KZX11808.1 amidophosphoribosyltransferase precursor [Methanobrevibacter curvatus]
MTILIGENILKDKCGIVGIHSKNKDFNAASSIYYGLYALQHRGQESAGIVTFDGDLHQHHGMGLLTDAFKGFDISTLSGESGIGHVRYSTTGDSELKNSQPFVTDFDQGFLSIAHNGDIINSNEIRHDLIREGFKFYSTTDSEVLCNLIKKEYNKTKNLIQTIENVSDVLRGSYTIVILINNELFAIRDPAGLKPLAIAKKDDYYMIASESVAFDVVGAKFIRDVLPGEIVYFENHEIKFEFMSISKTTSKSHCVFEYVYFARPDSVIDGRDVYQTRLNIGKNMFKEHKIADVDVVMPVPDSSIPVAIGYSRASGVPYGEGLIKNRYIGRTFIMPTQEERELAVKLKVNPIKSELEGKKIVLVDDSIVRGTTSAGMIQILREANVKEIHMLIGSPPIISPCYYGVSMASKKELIVANYTIEEIREKIDVDYLGYLSIESLVDAIGIPKKDLCLGCMNEEYPTDVPKNRNIETYYKF